MIAAPLLDPGGRPIIGHRGASAFAPENTLAGFDLALEQGAEALELDVRVSRDGTAIVIHDPTLDRTTDRAGPVAALSDADLDGVDAGYRFSPGGTRFPFRGGGVRIPTLREVLERYPTIPLLVEVKAVEAAPAIQAELIRAAAVDRVVVASFMDEAVEAFRKPPFLAGASRADIVALAGRGWLGLPAPGGKTPVCYAVPYRYRNRIEVPTRRVIRAAHRRAKAVHVWTVDDPALATSLWDRGVSGIITNRPGALVAARAGYHSSPPPPPPLPTP